MVEATFVKQPPKGPAYVVPPPTEAEETIDTPEGLVKKVLTDAIDRENAESGTPTWTTVDLAETIRQTIAKGGCDIEMLLRVAPKKGKPFPSMLGILLPGEGDDGAETRWRVLEKIAWQLNASRSLFQDPDARPSVETVPVYLWPNTGLHDPQEECAVWKDDLPLPGILGTLLAARSEQEKVQEQKRRRASNQERLDWHTKVAHGRRLAAAKRRELMGDPGITDAALDALVPEIDLDLDNYSMRLCYRILRLWERHVDALIEDLPAECVGLCLFGYRPPGVSAEDVLRRCAWVLRREMRDADAIRAQRATAALAALAAVHVDPEEVKRTLATMKLL